LPLAGAARAQERAVDAPVLSAPARPATLSPITAVPQLSLAGPLSAPLAPVAAPQGLAEIPQAQVRAAAPPAAAVKPGTDQHVPEHVDQSAVAPALPASALPAAEGGAAGMAAKRDRPAKAEGADDLESDAVSGGALFDNALAGGLSSFSGSASGSPAAKRYREAVKAAENAGWTGHGAAVSDAALALLAERGVKASREKVLLSGEAFDAVTITPERGLSPLNDLAYDLKKQLDTSLDLVPERTQSASGAYNAKEGRIMLTALDQPDFYLAALHEARHAWYSSLLRRGDIRLFHLQVVAKRGRSVAPGASTYSRYVSFEELSTFPKTLKHMLTEMAKLKGEDAEFLRERLGTRAWQLAEILKTADFISRQIKGHDSRRELSPRRMSAKEVEPTALQQAPGMDYFEEELAQAHLYFQVPRRSQKLLGYSWEKASAKEARAALRLRAELLGRLADTMSGPTAAYYEAVRAGDYAAAGRAADQLIKAVRLAEAEWAARSPHKS
jgi:hypothetical protein